MSEPTGPIPVVEPPRKRKKWPWIVGIVVAVFAFAGIAAATTGGGTSIAGDAAPMPVEVNNTEAPKTPSSESEPVMPESEEPDDSMNKRGNVEFAVGDTLGLSSASGDVIAQITVTSLEFITCQSVMGETANPLLMKYTITTPADASRSELMSVLNPFAISLYDASTGLTSPGQRSMPVCMKKSNELHVPTSLSPGSKYSGGMLFPDAPESGAVIYRPTWSANGAEWPY